MKSCISMELACLCKACKRNIRLCLTSNTHVLLFKHEKIHSHPIAKYPVFCFYSY